jgi:hypothetical protein
MHLPIYQNMVNLIVGFAIWRRPSLFMDVAMTWAGHVEQKGGKEEHI